MLKTILTRIAIVAWWIGALGIPCAVIIAIVSIVNGDYKEAAAGLLAIGLITIPLWIFCYILSGSFQRPPRVNEN